MWFSGKDRLLDTILRDTVLITMKDGSAFRGIFDGADHNHLRLLNAEALSTKDSTKVDGQLFLPRANIAFVQRP